ncbi:MAG: DciA family protein [Pseudomonadota bacterium]
MPKQKQANPEAKPEAGPPARHKRVQAVGGLLRGALGPLTAKQGAQLAQILPFWPSICPMLHAYGVPESLRAGELTIAAQTSSAQREFTFLAPSITEGANRVLGYEGVHKIRSVVRAQGSAVKLRPLAVPLPTGAAAIEKAVKVCQNVGDDELREALVRLGTRALKS